MNLETALAKLITCDKGLGRMLPKSCARLWLVANEKRPGTLQRECEGCPAGKRRSKQVGVETRMPTGKGRLNGAADRPCKGCREPYAPTNRRQLFCKRDECRVARSRLASRQAQQRVMGRPVEPSPGAG